MPRTDQVIAYAGLDVQIKESGLWKGQAKLSKRGSGLLRQTLYLAALRSIHLQSSAFGAYYRRLVARGRKCGSALPGGDAQNAGRHGPFAQTPTAGL